MDDVTVPLSFLIPVILMALANLGKIVWDLVRQHQHKKPASRPPPPGCPWDPGDVRELHRIMTAEDADGSKRVWNKGSIESKIRQTAVNSERAADSSQRIEGLLARIANILDPQHRDKTPTIPGGE